MDIYMYRGTVRGNWEYFRGGDDGSNIYIYGWIDLRQPHHHITYLHWIVAYTCDLWYANITNVMSCVLVYGVVHTQINFSVHIHI